MPVQVGACAGRWPRQAWAAADRGDLTGEDCGLAPIGRTPRNPHRAQPAGRIDKKFGALHRIDAAVTAFKGSLWVRLSAQAYNEMDDYERLAAAVQELKGNAVLDC